LQLRDGALTNRISRADVLEIATVGPGKGSPSAAAGFAVAGAVGAFLIDVGLALSDARCYGSCDSRVAMMVGVSVGLPLAGGFGGYYGFRKPAQRIVYRSLSSD